MTRNRSPERSVSTRRRSVLRALGAGVVGSALGAGRATAEPDGRTPLAVEASFVDFGVTGVAVGAGGRLFVNQPRFPWLVTDQGNRPRDATNVDVSVAEVRGGNSLVPYPDESWNADGWDQENDEWNESEHPAAETFVNVQSVYVDPVNPETLWVLDTGNPELSADGTGIVEDGPKLVAIDLTTDEVVNRVFYDRTGVDGNDLTPRAVDEPGAGEDANTRTAYLNDVRVSADQQYAFMTDSELGALVVTDLGASDPDDTRARRLFDDPEAFPQTHDGGVAIPVGPHEGQESALPIGDVHADGIAIDPDDEDVYFHALSGFELYRSPLDELTDFSLAEGEITIATEATTDATDGMIADGEGIYHTALGKDAVTRWNYGSGDGTETIAESSKKLHWPDSFSIGPDGDLYVTTSKIHLEATGTRQRPFRAFRIRAADL